MGNICVVNAAPPVPPDAGQILQQLAPSMAPPAESDVNFDDIFPTLKNVAPSEKGSTKRVRLTSVNLEGNTLFSSEKIKDTLGDLTNQEYEMADLVNLVYKIQVFYTLKGYPFTRVFLPEQTLENGELKIKVIEGKYGNVDTEGLDKLGAWSKPYLYLLKKNEFIQSKPLERTVLLLNDQPGMKASPIVRPGQELGTADLNVKIARDSYAEGSVSVDNFGSRFTGQYRSILDLKLNSPLYFGDQLALRAMLTDDVVGPFRAVTEGNDALWLGNLNYSIPLSAPGVRAQIGYSKTQYSLGKELTALGAFGTAKVPTAGISYNILRTQLASLTANLSYQRKYLDDSFLVINTNKESYLTPLTLQFDNRDSFGGGGITFGAITYTRGKMSLDANLKSQDVLSGAGINGAFQKLNLDVVRIQALPINFQMYGRLSAQWTHDNLDSSEEFGIAGNNGVRAYTPGEAFGDRGWLTQIELRYLALNGLIAPYIFTDKGSVTINARNYDGAALNNEKELAAFGIGTRVNYNDRWKLDGFFAWSAQGGNSQSDARNKDHKGWLAVEYKF